MSYAGFAAAVIMKHKMRHSSRTKEISLLSSNSKVSSCLKYAFRLGAVPQTCNSSYLGSRDQEDSGLRPALAKRS
jgi:hypothetical protein